MDNGLNVNRLYEVCRRLVQEGRGGFPVVVLGRNHRQSLVEEITIDDGGKIAVAIDQSVSEWSGE